VGGGDLNAGKKPQLCPPGSQDLPPLTTFKKLTRGGRKPNQNRRKGRTGKGRAAEGPDVLQWRPRGISRPQSERGKRKKIRISPACSRQKKEVKKSGKGKGRKDAVNQEPTFGSEKRSKHCRKGLATVGVSPGGLLMGGT